MVHIIYMIHSIGLNLVVEGVETKDEQAKIAALDPDLFKATITASLVLRKSSRKNLIFNNKTAIHDMP